MYKRKNDAFSEQYQAALRSHPRVHGWFLVVTGPCHDEPEDRPRQQFRLLALRLLLHILDARERNALGAFLGVAEIELVFGQEHRIAVDVVGDAGAVG